MSPTNSDTAAQSRNESQPTTLLEIKTASFQDIWEKDINAEKLVALLRRKFGANGYELYIIHSVYSIRAPEKLSQEEIELCK